MEKPLKELLWNQQILTSLEAASERFNYEKICGSFSTFLVDSKLSESSVL